MMSPYAIARRIALKYLPESMLHYVRKIYYARSLREFSLDQEPDLKVVQYLVRPGEHVVDIGSNIGVYTKVLSELVKEEGKVHSIEPVPQTFDILRSNISRLNLHNVRPVNVAISDRESVITMCIPLWTVGGENFYMAHIVDKADYQSEFRYVNVETKTLDSLFIEVADRISFIKCDVEAHELACIKGAKILLQKSHPAWLVEVSGDPDDSDSPSCELFKLFADQNYTPWYFNGENLKKRRIHDRSTNYFFLTSEHIEKLKQSKPKLLR